MRNVCMHNTFGIKTLAVCYCSTVTKSHFYVLVDKNIRSICSHWHMHTHK